MEQEFNQGTPPVGEAGMCFTDHGRKSYPQYWNGSFFKDSSPSAREAFHAQYRGTQDRHWRWATLLELLAAGLSKAEALPMLHASQRPQGDTAQPATSESDRDTDIGDGVDENARMLERDAAGMRDYVAPVPSFELRIEPEEAPGLLVLAPMERLGATRWGAQS